MTCELVRKFGSVQKFVSTSFSGHVFYELQCRYEAGFLLAYLAFVPFCEPGVMDGISLQVSGADIRTLSLAADDFFCESFPFRKIISSLKFLFIVKFRDF